jgi:hypothetical protein
VRPNRHSRTGRDGRHLFRTVAVDGYASTLIVANLNPAEDVGRGAIDTIFAAAATEQGRNQQAR